MISSNSLYIPTCLDYLPPVYASIHEFKQLAKTYDEELKILEHQVMEIYNNFHIDSLNEYGCTQWEKLLKLKINHSYTIEDRRFAIKLKLLGFLPYTLPQLKKVLTTMLGEGGFKIHLDSNRNHLLCKLDLGVKNQMSSVMEMLENIVPLNISLSCELLYNTHQLLGLNLTHEEMAKYTHTELKELKIPFEKEVI